MIEKNRMPLASRIFASDVELGKRDDDHRRTSTQPWSWKATPRVRRRRIFFGVVGLFLVYLFIHNIPTDLGSVDERMGRPLRPGHNIGGVEFGYRPPARGAGVPVRDGRNLPTNKEPTGPPPRSQANTEEQDHYFAGPVKYYHLAKTLQGLTRTAGYRVNNRNVLFAASNLKSAANLMPLACEMARVSRNYVHLVLLGRDAIPLSEILEINGVDPRSCLVTFHDGRSDYSEYSTDARAEVSVAGALGHIHTYMHPQVIITDDSAVEDAFFVRGMRSKGKELDRPIIEIPKGKYEDFFWITRLDTGSLSSWHKPSVNILIHAPTHSSGSLLRLLDSIKKADYAGLPIPDITIDLPADVESFVRDYLRDYEWPPKQDPTGPRQRKIKAHHRISTHKITTESNALRFLESFYPVNTDHSHVLLLSAQTELSPLYFHYLMFHMLEHRYSAYGSDEGDRLFGVVLASPHVHLNGSTPFSAPTFAQTHIGSASGMEPDSSVPFLWQAPNSDAALVFGDVWAEVHDYLKNRLRASHAPTLVEQPPKKTEKMISETQPGWLEYMLELMRARGWSNLYPAQREVGAWATVHQDLFQKPEEFMTTPPTRKANTESAKDDDDKTLDEEPFLRGEPSAANLPSEQRDTVSHSQPLHALLPFQDPPELGDLPSLDYSGSLIERGEIENVAKAYRPLLRQQIGGCQPSHSTQNPVLISGQTTDLFCFIGQRDFEDVEVDDETVENILGVGVGVVGEDGDEAAAAVSEPASYAVKDVDSAAKQKLAYAGVINVADEPAAAVAATEEKKTQKTQKKEVGVEGVTKAAAEKEGNEEEEEEVPRKHGGGTMKAVVEDLGPPTKPKDG